MPIGLYLAAVQFISGTPGVYELTPESSYRDLALAAALPLEAYDAPNFVFAAGRPVGTVALYAIKVRNTGSRMVEVHVIDRASRYRIFIRQNATPITELDGRNFEFLVGEYGDLVCVKRRNTGSGFVEVHVLMWDGFRVFSAHAVTPIAVSQAADYDFAVTSGNRVVAIQRAGTAEHRVVLHFLSDDYSRVSTRAVTSMDVAVAQFLTFRYETFSVRGGGTFSNLIGFTRGRTPTGSIHLFRLPWPWTGPAQEFPTLLPDWLTHTFQFVFLYPPPRP